MEPKYKIVRVNPANLQVSEENLNKTADLGYRVVTSQMTPSGMILVMERQEVSYAGTSGDGALELAVGQGAPDEDVLDLTLDPDAPRASTKRTNSKRKK